MVAPYPSIDSRRARKLAAELERLAEIFVPSLRGVAKEDSASRAMVEIAGRLAGQVTQRLDKTPRRDAIAFFHALDVPQQSPRPARAPLVFTLSEKQVKSIHVPARIQAAAKTDNGEEVIFETTSALNLAPARMEYFAAVDSKNDRIEEPPPQFLQLAPIQPQAMYKVTTLANAGSNTLQLSPAVGLEAGDVIGIDNEVYRIKESKDGLLTLVEQDRLTKTVNADTTIEKVTRFNTFQFRNLQRHVFYIGHNELLNLEQRSTIRLKTLPVDAANRLVNLKLTISIYGTKDGENQPDWHRFDSPSLSDGELLLFKKWPGKVDEVEIHGRKNRWLKIELDQSIDAGQPTETRIASFALRVQSGMNNAQSEIADSNSCFDGEQNPGRKETNDLCIPCETGEQEGSQTIKKAFHNITPLPLSTRFYPFGSEPLRFDTFALAAPEALSKKGAKVSLAIDLVDATPAAFSLAFTNSDQKHAYAIGVNGRLQILELSKTENPTSVKISNWQELGHPDKLPEDNTGSNDVKTLRLDSSRAPQASEISIAGFSGIDLVVVGDQGGRFWLTKVYKTNEGYAHSDWKILPPVSNNAEIIELVLLPNIDSPEPLRSDIIEMVGEARPNTSTQNSFQNFSSVFFPVLLVASFQIPAAFLFAITDQGFHSLAISAFGLPLNSWQSHSSEIKDDENNPRFGFDENSGARPRLIPVLPANWPSSNKLFLFVLLDADEKLWLGECPRKNNITTDGDWLSDIQWKLLKKDGNPELASSEVRPVAAKLECDSFIIFAATQEKRALFTLRGSLNNGGAYIHIDSDSYSEKKPEFIVQSGTEILCDPSFRVDIDHHKQPVALAFGQEKFALLMGNELKAVSYPERGSPSVKPSGLFIPINTENTVVTSIITNGRREKIYWGLVDRLDKFSSSNMISVSFPRADQNPDLSWEYFDGNGWQRLEQGFNDTTSHLAVSGRICFQVPKDIAPTEISGQEDYWIRARLVGGDYGHAKYIVKTKQDQEDPETTTQSIVVDTSDLRAPEILSIEACFEMTEEIKPEQVLTENNRAVLDQTQANQETSAQFELFEGAAAIDTQLRQEDQGRALYLGFTQSYDVNPLAIFIDADEPEDAGDQLKTVELIFEVFGEGQQWRKIAADDRTDGFQHRGMVNLFVDTTPQHARLFGRDLFWLRIRPAKNEQWQPLLNGIYINAVEAEQAKTIKQEILGASSGEPNQRFFLSKIPVIDNSLELRVRESLSEDERLDLEKEMAVPDRLGLDRMDKPVRATYPDIPGHWVLWQQVDSFVGHDGDARVYQLDPASGQVLFGNDRQGKIPPAGRDAVRAISYQNGGGETGNVEALSIEKLKSSVESVDSVTNPIPAAGGVNALDVDALISTAPDRLRHRHQALTPVDIEALAVAWSSEIVRARCLIPKQPTEPIKVYIARRTGERCPKASLAEREALARYLTDLGWGALGNSAIRVYNPDYVSISVAVEILAESTEVAAAVEKTARARLLKLLHPVDGGPDGSGWPFGRGIWKSEFFRILSDIPGLDRVEGVDLQSPVPDKLSPSSLICGNEDSVRVIVKLKDGEPVL